MAEKTARQRLEDWAESEGIDLSYSMQYDHDDGIGWDVSFFIEGRRHEPSLSFNSHHHSIEQACEGVLSGLQEYGISVSEIKH